MITDQQFIELLKKFHSGRCTEEETEAIDRYLESKKHNNAAFDTETRETLLSSTWSSIQASVKENSPNHTRRFYTQKIFKAAAIFLLISSISLVFYHNRISIYDAMVPVTYTTISSKVLEHKKVHLPDGSAVLLNQNSSIRYSNRFNKNLREITLKGEAYFNVAKNKDKPFVVHTGNINTRVLGTSFNIEAVPHSGNISVALITGKVWLTVVNPESKPRHFMLTPNQTFNYEVTTGMAEKNEVTDARNYVGWKDGQLQFTNTNLKEALRRVANNYGVRITLKDEYLAPNRIYGVFYMHEEPGDVLKNISRLIGAHCISLSKKEFLIVSNNHH